MLIIFAGALYQAGQRASAPEQRRRLRRVHHRPLQPADQATRPRGRAHAAAPVGAAAQIRTGGAHAPRLLPGHKCARVQGDSRRAGRLGTAGLVP